MKVNVNPTGGLRHGVLVQSVVAVVVLRTNSSSADRGPGRMRRISSRTERKRTCVHSRLLPFPPHMIRDLGVTAAVFSLAIVAYFLASPTPPFMFGAVMGTLWLGIIPLISGFIIHLLRTAHFQADR